MKILWHIRLIISRDTRFRLCSVIAPRNFPVLPVLPAPFDAERMRRVMRAEQNSQTQMAVVKHKRY